MRGLRDKDYQRGSLRLYQEKALGGERRVGEGRIPNIPSNSALRFRAASCDVLRHNSKTHRPPSYILPIILHLILHNIKQKPK